MGAGSAGTVIANRLSENPEWNILLLEAGGNPTLLTRIPLLAPLVQFTRNNWMYFTEPEEKVCNGFYENRCPVVRGKALGGSSQANYVIYARGHRRDYDDWAELGNEGWSYEEVLKYFIKSERLHVEEGVARVIDDEAHGRNGLQDTGYANWQPNPLIKAFLEAWKVLGFKEIDYNSGQQIGYSEMQTFTKNGERADVLTEFLKPFRNRTNLVVLKHCFVTKILIDDNKTAYGVEYIKHGKSYKVKATKEVIVSAGSINSPKLLMLSGIGLKDELSQFGIPVVKNLSVGRNYHDHPLYPGFIFKHTSLKSSPLNPLYFLQWLFTRTGSWTTSAGIPALGFTNTKDPNSDLPNAEIPIIMFSLAHVFFLVYPKPIYLLYFLKHALAPSFSFLPTVMRPKSRGYVTLRSRDPLAYPIIKGNYLHHPDDLETLLEMMQFVLNLTDTEPMKKIGVSLVTEKYPGCKEYEYGTREYWVCAVKHIGTNYYHPAGTCKMGPESDSEAVVNPKLQVYGIERLRVADTSIIPFLPNCHTNAVALMIGEKAADMIKEKWLN